MTEKELLDMIKKFSPLAYLQEDEKREQLKQKLETERKERMADRVFEWMDRVQDQGFKYGEPKQHE